MIKIICVGKIKEKYFVNAIDEYIKRISKYTTVNLIEVNDCSIDEEKVALRKEKDSILNKISDKDYVVTLEIDGNQLSSVDFASKIQDIVNHNSNLTFIIGGSFGLHDEVKERSNYKLSFSKMTYPHQLFRVMFLEQIYRAFKIINNERYHK